MTPWENYWVPVRGVCGSEPAASSEECDNCGVILCVSSLCGMPKAPSTAFQGLRLHGTGVPKSQLLAVTLNTFSGDSMNLLRQKAHGSDRTKHMVFSALSSFFYRRVCGLLISGSSGLPCLRQLSLGRLSEVLEDSKFSCIHFYSSHYLSRRVIYLTECALEVTVHRNMGTVSLLIFSL